MFVQMMYQLLLSYKFPFKFKKILCVGKSDSGKTSWLIPILEILDKSKIATLTKEGKFSAQLLTASTQLLVVDEYSPDKLQIDDAKVKFQGGHQFVSRKMKEPLSFVYSSGVYLTCNTVGKPAIRDFNIFSFICSIHDMMA